jgi:Fur family transcriptional regulator, peroxide stress response regulator
METKEILETKIKSSGRRMTSQRLAILDELKKVTSHPSAQEIYVMVQKKMPNVSFGTVYRNLKLLEDLGFLQELNYGKSFSRYDGNPDNHYHILCENCGRMDDIPLDVSKKLDKETSDATGYSVKAHRIEFYGKCPECREKENLAGL